MECYATLYINYKSFLIPHLQIFLILVNVSRYILVKKRRINAIEVSTFATKKFITGEINILFAIFNFLTKNQPFFEMTHFRYQIEAPNSKDGYTRGCVYPMEPHANPASYANQPINQRRTFRVADSLRKWQLPIGACADYDGAG